jgi:hypothetical protein
MFSETVAELPLAKDIEGFDFSGTPVNAPLVRGRTAGAFVAEAQCRAGPRDRDRQVASGDRHCVPAARVTLLSLVENRKRNGHEAGLGQCAGGRGVPSE